MFWVSYKMAVLVLQISMDPVAHHLFELPLVDEVEEEVHLFVEQAQVDGVEEEVHLLVDQDHEVAVVLLAVDQLFVQADHLLVQTVQADL